MDLRDVVTISPLGLTKTFDFSSARLVDSGLPFKNSKLISWDSVDSSKIFTTGTGKVYKISLTGESQTFNCPSYETDSSEPIGISACNNLVVIGKGSGKLYLFDQSDLSLKSSTLIASNLSVCKSYRNHLICGGNDIPFTLRDLEKPEVPIFTAKNVRPDTLDLRVPIWLSDASFVEGYEDRLFLTSSKYGDFCVYDVRSNQRRPVSRSAWRVSNKQGKKSVGTGHHPAMLRDLTVTRPITRCVAYTGGGGCGLRAVAGNAIGDICRLDFRVPLASMVTEGTVELEGQRKSNAIKAVGTRAAAPPAFVQGYEPAAGAISAMVCGGAGCANLPLAGVRANINHQPLVVTSSIDRFIRVYHRDTGKLLKKIFTKAPVSSFLIRDSATFPTDEYEDEGSGKIVEIQEKESDEIWSKMETVASDDEEPPAKRSKKTKKFK